MQNHVICTLLLNFSLSIMKLRVVCQILKIKNNTYIKQFIQPSAFHNPSHHRTASKHNNVCKALQLKAEALSGIWNSGERVARHRRWSMAAHLCPNHSCGSFQFASFKGNIPQLCKPGGDHFQRNSPSHDMGGGDIGIWEAGKGRTGREKAIHCSNLSNDMGMLDSGFFYVSCIALNWKGILGSVRLKDLWKCSMSSFWFLCWH